MSFFRPEDFSDDDAHKVYPIDAARIANAKLAAEGVRVKARRLSDDEIPNDWHSHHLGCPTHTALLIDICEITPPDPDEELAREIANEAKAFKHIAYQMVLDIIRKHREQNK